VNGVMTLAIGVGQRAETDKAREPPNGASDRDRMVPSHVQSVDGCTKVSPACDHCYAEAQEDARYDRVEWGGVAARVEQLAAPHTAGIVKRRLPENGVEFSACLSVISRTTKWPMSGERRP
jgi:hypothetical protein